MIAWLSGTLRGRDTSRLLVENGGIGFEIHVPARVAMSCGPIGSPVELHIRTHVREDGISLFGFASAEERHLFDLLTSVSGVGPKTALAVFSVLTALEIVTAIERGDAAPLKAVSGIGKRTAERLIVELRGKLTGMVSAEAAHPKGGGIASDDLVSALLNLGYRRAEADAAVRRLDLSQAVPFDTMLREALKGLAR